MLALYRGLTIAAGPLIGRYLDRRLAAGKEDPARFGERLGRASQPRPAGPLIWLHAASVGEAVSVLPLIARLSTEWPDVTPLLTTGTVTSARMMAERLPPPAIHQFVPVDRPSAVAAFIAHWRPDLAIWVESELWPNLIAATRRAGIPMVLVQGRMSARSFRNWRLLGPFVAPLIGAFEQVLAQTEADAERFRALGARGVGIAGNLKYAAPPLPADEDTLARLRKVVGDRPVWLAASTHPGEEAQVAEADRLLRAQFPDLLTIVVPRHPGRGAEAAAAFPGNAVLRSSGAEPGPETAVYVADTLGELGLFYRLAPITFVGGSLVPHGGQNLLEPARLGAAIVHGPHVANFHEVAERLATVGAAQPVADAAALADTVAMLLNDPTARTRMAEAGIEEASSQADVLDRVMAALAPRLHGFAGPKSDAGA